MSTATYPRGFIALQNRNSSRALQLLRHVANGWGSDCGEVLTTAKATGKLHRLILWGSFVTAKDVPEDLDLLLIMAADFDLAQVPDSLRLLFDYPQARIRFRADVFWTKATMSADILAVWLDTYQIGKDFRRRGIVEVIIHDSQR